MNHDIEGAVTPWLSIILVLHIIIVANVFAPREKAKPSQWIVALLVPIVGPLVLLVYKMRARRQESGRMK